MSKKNTNKKNQLQDLVNKAAGVDSPETKETPEVEEYIMEYDMVTYVPKKNKATGTYNIFAIYINSETLETTLEVEETQIRTKSGIQGIVSNRLRKLFQQGQYE